MIEQAKFTYSPLGKAFEKQIKTIEDQGEKKITVIQDQGQVKTIKKCIYDNEDTPLISKQKEIFLTDVKSSKEKFKSNLSEVKKHTKVEQKAKKNTVYNIEMLDKARNEAIKFYNDYSSMMSEAKLKATKGTGLKTIIPK